jgi:subtilisin-like proprotein convertase family protein
MKTTYIAALACLIGLPLMANAQSFPGAGGTIADGSGDATPGAAFTSTVTVPPTVTDPIVGVQVEFSGLNHTWVGDLWVRLVHPDGTTTIDLLLRPGMEAGGVNGYNADFIAANTYVFADAGSPLFDVAPATPIPSGTYVPSSNPNPATSTALPYAYTPTSFATTFGGLSAVGTWTLIIEDYAGIDTGGLTGWTLNIDTGPGLALDTSLLDFGDVDVGQTSAVQTVVVQSDGTQTLTVSSVGAAAAPFALIGGTCPAVPFDLLPTEQCTLEFTFSPTVSGAASQSLLIASNAPDSPATLQLNGNGLQAAVVTPVPTLTQWTQAALAALMALLAIGTLRRQRVR